MNTEKSKNNALKSKLYRLKKELENDDKRIIELKDENETIEEEQKRFNHNIIRLENLKMFLNKIKRIRILNIGFFSILSLITVVAASLISADVLLATLLVLASCLVIGFKDIKKYIFDTSKYLRNNMDYVNNELEKNLKQKSLSEKKFSKNNLELKDLQISQEKIRYSLEKLLIEFCNNNQISNEVIYEMIQIAPENFKSLSDEEIDFVDGRQKVK